MNTLHLYSMPCTRCLLVSGILKGAGCELKSLKLLGAYLPKRLPLFLGHTATAEVSNGTQAETSHYKRERL